MLKKVLSVLTIVGAVLVLAACSDDAMTGDTTTTCTAAPSAAVTAATDVTVIIEGTNEDIVIWTERITMSIDDYELYFFGMTGLFFYEYELEDWFAEFAVPVGGLSWNLVSISGETLVFEAIFDYDLMTNAQLSEIWGENFREVTLTAAINGLEYQGASCRTN